MELSSTATDALCDNGHEQNKSDRLYNINKCIQKVLENDRPTTALSKLIDSYKKKKKSFAKKATQIYF